MPELPEVETIACDLRLRGLCGSTIANVHIYQPLVVRPGAASVRRRLRGTQVVAVGRHGKLLLIELSGRLSLAIHLKMTGQLLLVPSAEPRLKHTHVVLELEGAGELRFRDIRRFGYLALLTPRELEAALAGLGPDALQISEQRFLGLLASRRARLKGLLTDQAALAGLGNIYANEILFEAGLNPWRPANGLTGPQARRLYRAMVGVLRAAITCRGSSTSDFVDSQGRAGSFQERHRIYQKERCPRCGGTVVRESTGGRPTFWCPACQPAGAT